MSPKDIETTDMHHPRIEAAFRQYIHRALPPTDDDNSSSKKNIDAVPPESKHEFEIIVCHANVIRYIMCRFVKFVLLCFNSFIPYVHCQLRRRYTYLHSYHHVHILSRCFDRTRWCHYYQRLTITSGGVVTLLSFQLQFNLSDDTSHWDGELSYDW